MSRRADGRNEEEREEREREENNDGLGAMLAGGALLGAGLALGYWLTSGRERTVRCALVVDGANVIHCHESASRTRFSSEDFSRYSNEMKQAFGSRLGKEIIFQRNHSVFVNTKPARWRERRDQMGALHESIERSGVSRDVDAVILFSGDGDFFHALDRVKQTTGKKIFVCGFRGTVSNALRRESVDHLHLIDVE
ncbi:unnamed protein product [Vitrella brassicaformis CCMP3155]|uniref:NYN domain-containing protein n=1 Tax=Vitrella brassicaformis (strain CCMP3155) TaxID=1169540 RepID=A0A0G4ER29_VITBC|nr:unnamed protein product [Vitrella brassicaformis CCMP3155]|eukprot:CEM00026.1 unnamed protein product [Vitrella brassicaformis CCMP3155]